jgi:hypothetical protein
MMLKCALARTICTLYYVNVNEKLPSGAGTAYNSMRHHQFLVGFVVLEGARVVGSNNSYKPITNMPSFVNYKKGCTQLAVVSDKVYQLLAQGWWFSPGTPASSTTKTGRHDIAEILLKVALNTKILIQFQIRGT